MRLRKRHIHARIWVLITALMLCAAGGAQAQASTLNLRQSLGIGAVNHQPGVRAAAPSAQDLATSVQQAAGVSLSDVTAVNVCGTPAPGHAACAAQELVLRSNHHVVHPHVTPQKTFTQVVAKHHGQSGAAAIAPQGSMSSTPAGAPSAGSPAYLQQAYDLTYLSQTAGTNDTVAIVDVGDDANAQLDLATYRSTYGLGACTASNGCLTKVNESGAASPLPSPAGSDWESEESLDLDAVSALCPNCHILLVEVSSSSITDLDAGIQAAIAHGANQISNSWAGTASSPVGISNFTGAAVIAATGDHGYPGAGVDNYPAAFPGVTAAGGTTLSGATGGTSRRGYTESAWSLNSSGVGWGGGSGCDTQEPKPAYQSDTGCTGRAYSDLSADANPDTGLRVYDSGGGGWFVVGGTSLATPLIAAFEALTGVNGSTAQWAYNDSALLNDPVTGSTGSCAAAIAYICDAGTGYDGPTGIGSISGAIASGAPGIGGPAIGDGTTNSYTQTVATTTAALVGGVYPNGLDTTYYWQYGTSTAYGQQTTPQDIGSGTSPVTAQASLSALTPGVTYHYRLVATNSAGTDYGYDYTFQTSNVTNVAPVNTAAPVMTGQALQGQTVTASTGSWSPTPTSFTYQWQRSTDGGSTWTNISGAIASSYTVASGDLGDQIQAVVSATNSYGTTPARTTPATVGSGAPAITAGPTVSGHPDQGQVLSAVSTWNPAGASYTYQWQSSSNSGSTWTNISGATSSTYTLVSGDLGNLVRVSVTAVNSFGSATAASSGVGPILNNAPVNTGVPAVSGNPQRASTLSATSGTWTGLGNVITYQWQRSVDGTAWTSINGAVSSGYTLQFADEGDAVRALVTATNASGVTSVPTSATVIIAPFPPANTGLPVITGVAERGVTLAATQGSWTGPDNIYTYQWQRDAGEGYVNISGATAMTYTLGTDDEGATVRVVVTATDPDATISQASAPTAAVTDAIPVNTDIPSISGTVQRGYTLTAASGTWAGIGNGYSYQWQRSADSGASWTNINNATDSIYAVTKADEANTLRVVVTAVNPDGTATASSAATITVPSSPPVATTAPSFVGTPQRGQVLTGAQGTWSAMANAYSYQWQRSADGSTWTNISGATSLSYTVQTADESDFLRFTVVATNPDGTTTASSTPSGVVVATPPVNTAVPTLLGTPARSASLTATAGSWNGIGNTYTSQWQRSNDNGSTWTNISGATGFAYTIAVADEGYAVRALITATNADGTVAKPSAATPVITAAPPVATTSPTITGPALRGDTLQSTQGQWSGLGNAYSYQWQRSANGTTWTAITGATSASYTLTTADVGDAVRLLVTATNLDATVSAPSNVTMTVAATPPANTAVPAIAGAAQRGLTLNSAAGTWNGVGNSYAYQWQRSADGSTWTNITGATGTSYQLVPADEGDAVRLTVTATNADGAASASSAASATVLASAPSNTVAPVIQGTAQRGQTLQSSAGTWLGIGNSYAYQWQRSTDNGSTWANITGANTAQYPLGTTDENSQLRVVMTASNVDGTATATSAATATVPTSPPVNTVAPTISGTAQRGFILSATPGAWNGQGNTLAYQWQRSIDNGTTWTSIAGATANTYSLGIGDEGAIVRVQVTASNPDATVNAYSTASVVVLSSPPLNNSLPTIRGVAQRGNSLSSTTGAWSGTGNTFALQWQRSADNGATWVNIAGATTPSYTLQAPDEGDVVRLVVTASNPDGNATAASGASATVLSSPPVNTAAPVVTGTPQRTATLKATSGSWSGAGVTVTYQWQRSADNGASWTNISGATTAAYTVAAADEGDIVRVMIAATDADATVSAPSAPSPVIQAATPVNTVAPVVLGTPSLGNTLSTDNGTWTPTGDTITYAYQWQRGDAANGYSNISGATSATYTTVSADSGENIRVIVTATNIDGSLSATSSATLPVQPPPVNVTAPAAPSGTLQNGFILTPDNGSWSSAATYAYTWMRCPGSATTVTAACTQISTGSSYSLTVSDIGSKVAVIVTATSIGGTTSATSALTAAITGQPLTQQSPPSITGNPQPPNTLYANPGTWSVTLTNVDYDWERCDPDGVSDCTLIAADTAHYTLSSGDNGHTIVLIANVSSPGRVATAASAALTVQNQPLPQATVLPTVSGNPVRGNVMGATGGQWSNNPRTISYQWMRCNVAGRNCLAIPGATQSTYTLTSVDEGSTVTIAVSATNTSGTTTAQAAQASGVVGSLPPVSTGRPALSTNGIQQSVPVTVTQGTWQATGTSTYTMVWERCNSSGAACAPISGATTSSYTPTASDVGHTLLVVVTATNIDGSASASSLPSAVVLPAAPRWRDLPVLSATNGYVGGVLSVTDGVFTGPAVTSDTTQIMRCTNACTPISTSSSYTIANADIGAILRLRETASNAGGTAVVWSAQYVGPVASSASASVVLGTGQAVLRNQDGDPLATAQLSAGAGESTDALVAHATSAASHKAAARVITVRRAAKVKGALRAWVCSATIARSAAPAPCTKQATIRGASGKLTLPATLTGKVRVVVVRRGH